MLRVSPRPMIVALLAAFAFTGVAAADTRPPQVVIRIYDGTAADGPSRAAAIETAAAIIADAGIHAAWHDCTGDAQQPACTPSRRGRELIIRIMAAPAPGTAPGGGTTETGAVGGTLRSTLGSAVIDPATGVGSLATIYMDRIAALAQRTDVAPGAIVGLTMAHEVGHLLLGTPTHGRTGLMREVWTDRELVLGRHADWLFAPSDRQMLQRSAVNDEAFEPFGSFEPFESFGPLEGSSR
jgi:hypothetical protein